VPPQRSSKAAAISGKAAAIRQSRMIQAKPQDPRAAIPGKAEAISGKAAAAGKVGLKF
jgi:hypothetical protein